MTTLDTLKLKTKIYDAGRLVNPSTVDLSLSSSTITSPRGISVAASASNVTIPITTRGTIRTIILWTDKGVSTVSVKINGSAARAVNNILRYDGNPTTLTVSNSDTVNAATLNVGIITA